MAHPNNLQPNPEISPQNHAQRTRDILMATPGLELLRLIPQNLHAYVLAPPVCMELGTYIPDEKEEKEHTFMRACAEGRVGCRRG